MSVAAGALCVGCAEADRDPVLDLRAVLGSADAAGSEFGRADRVREFDFPDDHGAHREYRTEWWYLTAVVSTTAGAPREFGVQFTLFRQGLEARSGTAAADRGPEAWRTGNGYMAHIALTDVAAGRHLAAERFSRGHPALAGAQASPFNVHLEDWRLASTGDDFSPLQLTAGTADFAADLLLATTRPVILQGDRGLSRKGPDNASYYYSVPRIDARGEIAVGDATYTVSGLAWLDREWSTRVLAETYAGWDWFAFHLDDGRDLMLYRLRRVDGLVDPFNSGSLGDGGGSRTLTAGDFTLTPLEYWRGWPVAWRLELAHEDRQEYVVRAAINDQVMDGSVRYWEGMAYLDDAEGRRRGSGYMELTGY